MSIDRILLEDGTSVLLAEAGGRLLLESTTPALPLSFTGDYAPYDLTGSGATNGTRINAAGLIVAATAPRFGHLINGTYSAGTSALLVEPAATNILLQSENLSTTWATYVTTLSANSATAPDGNATADKIIASAATDAHAVLQPITGAAAGQYVYSHFFKAAGHGYAYAVISTDGSANRFTAVVNLSTGAITATNNTGSPIGTASGVENYGGGWYRLWVRATHTSGDISATGGPCDVASPSSWIYGAPIFAGNGTDGANAWGAQIELGAKPTTYIPTTTASVTRTADANTFTVPSGTGGLVFTFDDGSTQTASVSPGAYAIPTSLNGTRISSVAAQAGPISGGTSLALAPSAVLSGSGALLGTSAALFTPTGLLKGAGALVGASTVVLSPSATGLAVAALVGSSVLTLTPAGALNGVGALAGAAAVTLVGTSVLSGIGVLAASASLVFAPVGFLQGLAGVSGASALSLAPVGLLTGSGALSGSTGSVLDLAGTLGSLSSVNPIAGDTRLGLVTTGAMAAFAFGSGSAELSFNPFGELDSTYHKARITRGAGGIRPTHDTTSQMIRRASASPSRSRGATSRR